MTWLPATKYERIPIEGATGPGTMYDGTYWKFCLHTTESPPGSINGIVSLFRSKPSYCPHITIDPLGTRRRIQHIRLDWSACALRGGQGGWQTNRARAIQMEVCGYSRDTLDWPDEALVQIADVIADCMRAGYPINPDNVPDSSLLRGTLATASAPQRFSGPAWHDFDGIAAHVYVPFNDHWDAGNICSPRIGELVKDNIDGTGVRGTITRPTAPNPPTTPTGGLIAIGMAGGIVKHIQELLDGLGYHLALDGDFGPATQNAVRQFQTDHDLDVDGVVGPATQAALSAAYIAFHSGTPAIPAPIPGTPAWPGRYFVLTRPYMVGGDIKAWQARMAARGWRIDADGVYGDQSYGVCKTFQYEKGLTRDGVVGPQTWTAAWSAAIT